MICPLLQRSPWYCTLFLTAFLSEMEGEPTAKNVQKGARFKIQRESEARMLIRLYGESPVAQVVRASD